MDPAVDAFVRDRAGHRCEYCLLPQNAVDARFPLDHIIARQHHGTTDAANLALACHRCNRHKGPNLSGIDPATGAIIRLFNPRVDRWSEHFAISDATLVGLTPQGRATVDVLDVNDAGRVALRRALIEAGRF